MKTSAFETVLGLMITGEEKFLRRYDSDVGLIYRGDKAWLYTFGIVTVVFDSVYTHTTDGRLCDLYMGDRYVAELDLKGVRFE